MTRDLYNATKSAKELVEVDRSRMDRLYEKASSEYDARVVAFFQQSIPPTSEKPASKEGDKVLSAVAEVIRNDKQLAGRYFQVAGHTDNKPLKGGRFGDNWGLSAMRARQVLLYLVAPVDAKEGGGGLTPERLHVAGYGDTDPVAKNDADEGRQQNRRVELVLMPDVEEMLDLKSLI
jgi:flagellar motor protein MotB